MRLAAQAHVGLDPRAASRSRSSSSSGAPSPRISWTYERPSPANPVEQRVEHDPGSSSAEKARAVDEQEEVALGGRDTVHKHRAKRA